MLESRLCWHASDIYYGILNMKHIYTAAIATSIGVVLSHAFSSSLLVAQPIQGQGNTSPIEPDRERYEGRREMAEFWKVPLNEEAEEGKEFLGGIECGFNIFNPGGFYGICNNPLSDWAGLDTEVSAEMCRDEQRGEYARESTEELREVSGKLNTDAAFEGAREYWLNDPAGPFQKYSGCTEADQEDYEKAR